MAYIIDLVIVALLAFFAWRGAAKGLVLSLCGLAAVFVAFFAAQFISDAFCAPVANIIRPIIAHAFEEVAPPTSTETDDWGEQVTTYGSMSQMLDNIEKADLFSGFSGFLEDGVASHAVSTDRYTSPAEALAAYLARGISKTLLFGIVFVGIQLVWFLLSHALDLAFKLPILSQVNLGCGLALGLVKGVLLIIVLVWLGQLAGVVPNQPETPVLSLFTVEKLSELLESLPA